VLASSYVRRTTNDRNGFSRPGVYTGEGKAVGTGVLSALQYVAHHYTGKPAGDGLYFLHAFYFQASARKYFTDGGWLQIDIKILAQPVEGYFHRAAKITRVKFLKTALKLRASGELAYAPTYL
jgi:hypothetical protein